MAVKKDKTRQRGVSQAKCETPKRIVLVGTYKGDQLTKWRGWYKLRPDRLRMCEAALQLSVEREAA